MPPDFGSPLMPHGGYENLRSYAVAEVVYDATVIFCDRFSEKTSRTHDPLVQAARSGVRNISEGSGAAATCHEFKELHQSNVSIGDKAADRTTSWSGIDLLDDAALAMHSKFKTAIVLILALLWSRPCAFAADAAKDLLWSKAVAVAAANAGWVPGLTITRSEVLRKGQVIGVHEMWRRSKPGAKSEVVTETVKILEDGKDVTKQEEKKNKVKGDPEKADGKWGGNPFDAGVQDRLSIKVVDRCRTIDGQACVGYAFELRNTNGPLVKGTAWLEKNIGVPLEIENMTLDPLPDKHLTRLVLTTRYAITASGDWLVKTMTANSTMSVMLIKADGRTTTTFSEHWKRHRHETTASKDGNNVPKDD
jgi:hypothetical protein